MKDLPVNGVLFPLTTEANVVSASIAEARRAPSCAAGRVSVDVGPHELAPFPKMESGTRAKVGENPHATTDDPFVEECPHSPFVTETLGPKYSTWFHAAPFRS